MDVAMEPRHLKHLQAMADGSPVSPLPLPPAAYIEPASPFSPHQRLCCQCRQTSPEPSVHQQQQPLGPAGRRDGAAPGGACTCGHDFCPSGCLRLDRRGGVVIPQSFPASWACSTCGTAHASILPILAVDVDGVVTACPCGAPTLQAIYDQFGRIFLFWRHDPDVFDLADPAKVQEAAWRAWEAGAEPWVSDVVAFEAEREARKRKSEGTRPVGWSRLSQSSLSTVDSLDVEMAGMN